MALSFSIGPINTRLGDFVNLIVHFWLWGLVLNNPIIYGFVTIPPVWNQPMTDRSWKYNSWGTPFPPFNVAEKSHVFSSFIGLKVAPIGRLFISLCRLKGELLARSILSGGSQSRICDTSWQKDKNEVCFIFLLSTQE